MRPCLLALLAGTLLFGGEPVVLVSFDGLGHQILTTDPAASPLRTFQQIRRAGVTVDGVQPHFPSTTANSHAAIFTGAYGNVSGISFNEMPRTPRPDHRFEDRQVGFRSLALRAEPIWVAAARQGKRVVAHQVTQAYPFRAENTAAGAVVANGYQTATIAPWTVQAVRRDGATEWTSGPYRFRFEPSAAGGTVRLLPDGGSIPVAAQPVESRAPESRPLARHFSPMLALPGATPLGVHFRLFRRTDGSWRLLQSAIQELALHDGRYRNDSLVQQLLAATGAAPGNGASRLRGTGEVTDAEYLESLEFQIRQAIAHTRWLHQRFRPDLFLGYLPFPDESDHAWLGLDRFGDPAARRYRVWAYAAIEQAARQYAGLAGRAGSVVFVSDHGMTPIRQMVNIRALLEQQGLSGSVSYLTQAFLLNGEEWKDGRITGEDQPRVLAQLRTALTELRDPDTGDPLVTGIFTPAEHAARYGIGGPTGGDLYFDLAPRWMAGYSEKAPLLSAVDGYGTHGFLPSRDDMLAITIARGPRFPRGATWPRMRSVAIAPLVADLLGIQPPRDAKEPSPLNNGSPTRQPERMPAR